MQVRTFSALDNRWLTRKSNSRNVRPQRSPLCNGGRISTWRTRRLSQGNSQSHSERYRTLGKGPHQAPHLLVERAGRHGEECRCEDDRGEVVWGRSAWGLFLLFKGFQGSKGPSTHIPDAGHPTCAQVPRISKGPRPVDPVGSNNRPLIVARSNEPVDCSAPQKIRHFNCDHRRCFGRMRR